MRLAGIFSGMGSQWPGMVTALTTQSAQFAQIWQALDAELTAELGWSVAELLADPQTDEATLAVISRANPAIFMVQLALYRWLQAQHIQLDMVLGHSTGEFAAACAAGALTVPAALALMDYHHRLLAETTSNADFAMAQLTLSDDQWQRWQQQDASLWQGVYLAARNSASSLVFSGPQAALQTLVTGQQQQGLHARLLPMTLPFHSPYLAELAFPAAGLPLDVSPAVQATAGREQAPLLYSSLRGRRIDPVELDGDYWQQHIRQPVLFAPAVEAMLADGATTLIEIAPHHILLFSLNEICRAAPTPAVVLPSLKRQADCYLSGQQLLQQLQQLSEPGSRPAGVTPKTAAEVLALILQILQPMLPVSEQLPDQQLANQGFLQLGLQSSQILQFSQRLAQALTIELQLSWCFDHPTPQLLANALSQPAADSTCQPAAPVLSEPVAIIGIGCRFPGGANNPELFWQRLQHGPAAIAEIPATRWDGAQYYSATDEPGKSRSKWAGFLQHPVADFDAALFQVPPPEATAMDPQQRLLLEVCYEAIQHAGLVPGATLPVDTGVFVGISTDDYKSSQLYSGDLTLISAYTGSGCMYSATAGRLSYWLGLQGPNKAIDTACSSSLVALHDACQSIRRGECSTALVAGVNLLLSPHLFVCFSALGALSADGVCRAFADGANGYVRGEGCGALVLKSYRQALADGDQILALIPGSAVNQDGISSSFTAPNGSAQQQVIRQALLQANLSPAAISYVETHGTGTPLGDPIEAQALGAVYGKAAGRQQPLWLGAAKARFGHLEAAAGVLAVIKAVLCLRQQQLPAQPHFAKPSALIPFDTLNLTLNQQAVATALPYAAVSSFGFSGTNAHLILQAAPAQPAVANDALPQGPWLFVLSAHQSAALQQLLHDWLQLLQRPDIAAQDEPQSARWLAELAGASLYKRAVLAKRLVLIAADKAGLADLLHQALAAPEQQLFWQPGLAEQPVWLQPSLAGVELSAGQAAELLLQQAGLPLAPATGDAANTRWPDRFWFLQQLAQVCLSGQPLARQALKSVLDWQPANVNAEQLPLQPYCRKTYWLAPQTEPGPRHRERAATTAEAAATWLGQPDQLAGVPELRFYRPLLNAGSEFLAEHQIFHTVISPAAAHLTMLLTALAQLALPRCSIQQLELHQPLAFAPEETQRRLELCLHGSLLAQVSGANAAGVATATAQVTLRSQHWPLPDAVLATASEQALPLHCKALLQQDSAALWQARLQRLQQVWQGLPTGGSQDASGLYQHLTQLGYHLGPSYQAIRHIYLQPQQRAWCLVKPRQAAQQQDLLLPPGLMDSLLQTLICSVPDVVSQMQAGGWIYIPFSIGSVQQFGALDQSEYWCYSETRSDGSLLTGQVLVFAADGSLRLAVDDFAVKQTDERALLARLAVSGPAEQAGRHLPAMQLQWLHKTPSGAATAVTAWHCPPDSRLPDVVGTVGTVGSTVSGTGGGRQCCWLQLPPVASQADWFEQTAQWLRQQIPQWLAAPAALLQLVVVGSELDADEEPAGAALIALHQVLRLEFSGQLLDLCLLPAGLAAAELNHVLRQMPGSAQAAVWRYQHVVHQSVQQGWQQRCLSPLSLDAFTTNAQPAELAQQRPLTDGTVLLTGGRGALASVLLPQLFSLGAAAVVLCSRQPEPADWTDWLASLQPALPAGAQVRWAQLDIADGAALNTLLQQCQQQLPPLCAVVHTAGELADSSLLQMDNAQLSRVLRPKTAAAWQLHLATRHLPLRFFIMYSSVASVLGNFGQANYAMANGFMDGLAAWRRRQDLPALSINWGPWQQGGMALSQQQNINAQGYQWLTAALLQPYWPALLACTEPQLLVARADWGKLHRQLNQVCELASWQQAAPAEHSKPAQADWQQWQQLPRAQAQAALQDWLHTLLGNLLGLDSSTRLVTTQSLMEQGVDSLLAVTIRSQLNQQLSLQLPVSLLFNFPSIDALVQELSRQLFSDPVDPATTTDPFAYLESISADELQRLLEQEFSLNAETEIL